jgi:hypothetical protein
MKKIIITAALIATAAALAGCSSGPSDSDIKAAIQQSAAGMGDAFKIEKVTSKGCSKSGDGYNCLIEVESSAFGEKQDKTAPVHFQKIGSKWVMTQAN